MRIKTCKIEEIINNLKEFSEKDLNKLSEEIKKELMERKIRVINGER